MNIGKKLLALRLEKGAKRGKAVTQKEAAEAMDYTSQHLCAMENGRKVSLPFLQRVAAYYNVSMSELLKEEENENENT